MGALIARAIADLVTAHPEGATFAVRAAPGAARCAVVLDDTGLRVRVDAPPVDGAANERLTRFLARDVFRIPARDLQIAHGEHGRNKTLVVRLTPEIARQRLSDCLE